jgi:hypothetical protein
MFACHRAVRNVRGGKELKMILIQRHRRKSLVRPRLNHADPDPFGRFDPGFDMAADRLFHSHPV